MRVFQDIFTNKVYTIENNIVTDAFNNVATISADQWLELQGNDIIEICEIKQDRFTRLLTQMSYNENASTCNHAMNSARILLGLKHKDLPSDKARKIVTLRRLMLENVLNLTKK